MKTLVAQIALAPGGVERIRATHSRMPGDSEAVFSEGCLIQYDKSIHIGKYWDIYSDSSGVCYVIYKRTLGPYDGFSSRILEEFRRGSLSELGKADDIYYLIIFDKNTGNFIVRGNQYGLNKIYYFCSGDVLIVSNRAENLIAKGASGNISNQSLYDYVYFNVIPAPTSVYSDISIVAPGKELICKNRRLELREFWKLVYADKGKRSASELKELFFNCVKSDIDNVGKTGAFLSGGLDSSTISGFLQKASSSQIPTFSIGFDEEGYDETFYARAAATHYGTEYHDYCVTSDDVIEIIPIIASSYSEPFGNSSTVPAYFCAKLAREAGITRLLAGDGGDELFGGNERYRKQLMLNQFRNLPIPLRSLMQSLLCRPFADGIPFLGKLSSYIRQAETSMPERMERYNLIDRVGREKIFSEDFLATIDARHPQIIMNDTYSNIGDGDLLNKMLAYDFKFTLIDNDLPKVVGMCDAANIDVAFPYLNEEMIAFAGSLPVDDKTTVTELRVFFRKSMQDFLPREVISKKKHGFGLPIGLWIMSNARLRDFVCKSIQRLEGTILREKFCDSYFREYMSQHASYYGTLLWVLMILSEWLSRDSALHKFKK